MEKCLDGSVEYQEMAEKEGNEMKDGKKRGEDMDVIWNLKTEDYFK